MVQLTKHPFCQECARQGIVTAAQCVHHIKPIESSKTPQIMEELAFNYGNLMSLCFKCHGEIHKEMRSWTKEGHQQRVQDRLDCWKARHGIIKNKDNDTE